ncbi:ABC transporter permease [Agrococcus jejuensis]|uniref:Osmoprotectant transport system permease protein n=1 Tax=Agrococcus jejuensis TaxID=399736 RepID=A0A1G8A6L2_9MICO|nr:ABC transporter permease [Agrococcus jejuensis]SDH16523.1 osmoprotectant transport system permease protein [Agrococcus jejuensis]
MEFLLSAIAWIFAPEQWAERALYPVPVRLVEHLWISLLCVVIAAVVALPLGCWIGHTGKGRQAVIAITSAARAAPALGVLFLLVMVLTGPLGTRPAQLVGCVVALAILAIPSILAGAYSGIEGVDRVTIDAARASGMTEWQILTKVELPLAAPVIVGGLRSAVLMVIATATIASFAGLSGLGLIIAAGINLNDYDLMLGASLLVAVLAIVVDLLLALVQRAAQRARHLA